MKILQKYFSVLLSIAVLIVYFITLAPSVVQIDAGELAAVQITFGISSSNGLPTVYYFRLPIFTDPIAFYKNLPDEFTCCNLLCGSSGILCANNKIGS
ncbi:MAG: hypothetical protein MZV64_03385 [Ignavibacteriales bacterium]|nr:hypothetical protein [Ignavibacteriales bacterium]